VDGLVDALVADATERIDAAVESGRLTEERATELKEGLEARTQDLVDGELDARPFGGFRHGFGGPGPFSDRSRSGPRA
jgi:hypothetical protein